jgi:AcrR family transcriptional regulator
MGHTSSTVVDTALAILDEHGLPGLTMRRVASSLGVQQSALYWHFESKQLLLAAMAEEILRRGRQPRDRASWEDAIAAHAAALRTTLLAHRDGAELVSTVYAFGLGAEEPHRRLATVVAAAGATQADADVAATVIWQFVLGYTFSEQQHLQASSVGAIQRRGRAGRRDPFDAGVALVVDGIRARLPS